MLLRLLVARLGNREDAEDALQDLWFNIDRLGDRPIDQPAAFLYRAAANLATDRRIAATRRTARDAAWLSVQPAGDEFPEADRVLIARERLRGVEAIVAAMPERMRTALALFRLEGWTQAKIAEHLGITVSGVEKLLRRAYRQLHDAKEGISEGADHPRRVGHEGSANDA